jgi:hypothetical protein
MRKPPTVPLAVGVALFGLVLAGCTDSNGGATTSPTNHVSKSQQQTTSTPRPIGAWPAPPDPLKLAIAAGLKPEVKEFLINHVHAHLDVFIDGTPVIVPSGIGINIQDPNVHKFPSPDGSTAYGGIALCHHPCISPLHTHDTSGILHTESATPEPNTLGQFFTEWGVRLTDSCVEKYCSPHPIAFYVDGTRYSQDPRAIELSGQREIAVVIGTPPAHIPATADFSQA